MKKIAPLMLSLILGMGPAGYVHAETNKKNTQNNNPVHQNQIANDPFNNDPFFQSPNNIFKEMEKMHQAMGKLMNQQFANIQNNLSNRYSGLAPNNLNNIQVKEDGKKLLYKIKLPKGADNKVDVSIKNGHLIISSNITQKISNEQDNSKSISYTHSSNTQSFKVPSGYDEKSLSTKMSDNNLIVVLNKK